MKRGSLFLADIDGTLVRTNTPLTDAVAEAAAAFADAGGRITVCTGRPPVSTREIARRLHIVTPGIVFGGGMIYDFVNGAPLWQMCMTAEVLHIVREIRDRFPSVAVLAYTAERIYTLRANRRLRERGVREESGGQECPVPQNEDAIQKITLIGDDIAELESIGERYVDQSRYEFAFASSHFAEITLKGVNKGTAMQMLSELCGVERTGFFAAGDAMTDIPMLQMAGTSFAMGDAPEAVRRIATHVVGTAEEDGMQTAFDIARALIQ